MVSLLVHLEGHLDEGVEAVGACAGDYGMSSLCTGTRRRFYIGSSQKDLNLRVTV